MVLRMPSSPNHVGGPVSPGLNENPLNNTDHIDLCLHLMLNIVDAYMVKHLGSKFWAEKHPLQCGIKTSQNQHPCKFLSIFHQGQNAEIPKEVTVHINVKKKN